MFFLAIIGGSEVDFPTSPVIGLVSQSPEPRPSTLGMSEDMSLAMIVGALQSDDVQSDGRDWFLGG